MLEFAFRYRQYKIVFLFVEVIALHNEVHQEAKDWFNSLPAVPLTRIRQHFGQFPELEPEIMGLENGPAWAWYVVAVLPLDARAQVIINCAFFSKYIKSTCHSML